MWTSAESVKGERIVLYNWGTGILMCVVMCCLVLQCEKQ
jgi:hypothetical protein